MPSDPELKETANQVDSLFNQWLVHEPDSFSDAVAAAEKAGLPHIQVSPTQGKLLYFLAKLVKAQRILEIGTLGGYSSLWMAKALPDTGQLVTLEFEPKHAAVARENFARAGANHKIEVREGAALDLLPQVQRDFAATFDLVFIDADKNNCRAYFDWAQKLTKSGGLIITDNVVQGGKILEADSSSPNIIGIRDFLQVSGSSQGFETTAVQTIGGKGHDGYAITLVN